MPQVTYIIIVSGDVVGLQLANAASLRALNTPFAPVATCETDEDPGALTPTRVISLRVTMSMGKLLTLPLTNPINPARSGFPRLSCAPPCDAIETERRMGYVEVFLIPVQCSQ